jgi:glyoxylase-like metal-dependent hydrolase (beta-lactamase superfamily II)
MDGRTSSFLQRGRLACHCLLVDTGRALVLVDTGFGLSDIKYPRKRLSSLFLALLSPDFREEMTAIRQIERLGYAASDVRHIVLTHLDFDHAGGLDDFPHAAVHMMRRERDGAVAQRTWMDRQRFRPQQWSTQPNWRVYQSGEGEPWYGFDCVRELEGLGGEILLVPLIGHTLGHAGVAVKAADGWVFQAGDAYFFREEMHVARPRCTPGLRFYQWMMEKDRPARIWNQQRLRELKQTHGTEIDVFCAHDLVEFERHAGRRLDEVPAGRVGSPPPGPESQTPFA